MSALFSRSMRSLSADSFHGALLGMGAAGLLLAAWGTWLTCARVAVLESTATARLEVGQATHAVAAPVAGRVVRTHLSLGRTVAAGEVLIELDAETEQLALAEGRARLAALPPQLDAVRGQIEAERRALRDTSAESRAALATADSRRREEDLLLRHAAREKERMGKLYRGGSLRELDLVTAQDEAENHGARTRTLEQEEVRLGRGAQAQRSAAQVRIARLLREEAEAQGRLQTEQAGVDRLEHEIERRRIRAPVTGTLGEIAELHPGSVMREGDRLAAVVPHGQLRIVADFPAARALGRLREGQPARLRLTGFSWTEYGTIPAVVSRVGSEVRGDQVRAELQVTAQPGLRAPLQHGLPGTVEVEVERVSPLTLLMRAAGVVL